MYFLIKQTEDINYKGSFIVLPKDAEPIDGKKFGTDIEARAYANKWAKLNCMKPNERIAIMQEKDVTRTFSNIKIGDSIYRIANEDYNKFLDIVHTVKSEADKANRNDYNKVLDGILIRIGFAFEKINIIYLTW